MRKRHFGQETLVSHAQSKILLGMDYVGTNEETIPEYTESLPEKPTLACSRPVFFSGFFFFFKVRTQREGLEWRRQCRQLSSIVPYGT
jgi:hypothetical protein